MSAHLIEMAKKKEVAEITLRVDPAFKDRFVDALHSAKKRTGRKHTQQGVLFGLLEPWIENEEKLAALNPIVERKKRGA